MTIPAADTELGFLHPDYRRMLRVELQQLSNDGDVMGVMLMGSLARGDFLPGSDIDLWILVTHGRMRPFEAELVDGFLVERIYVDVETASTRISSEGMYVYHFLDARILHDADGVLARLKGLAEHRLATYTLPPQDRRSLVHWLRTARSKMMGALTVDSSLKAAFVATTSSWKILEGLWAVNDKPVPPAGSVWAHLDDLRVVPENVREQLRTLFEAEGRERVGMALDLIGWILPRLDADPTAA